MGQQKNEETRPISEIELRSDESQSNALTQEQDPTDHLVVQVKATADIPDQNGMKVDYILYPKEDREPTYFNRS